MGRSRKVDREALLDAAQDVILSDGASNLTIEAVASRLGVGKATVLYDFKTKQSLMRAILERRLDIEDERLNTFSESMPDAANAAIRGWIRAAQRPLSEQDRTLGMGLIAELASDPDLNAVSRQFVRRRMADIIDTASAPRGATLAFLAVEGLKMLDYLGLHKWTAAEIDTIIEDISWLAEQAPETNTKAKNT